MAKKPELDDETGSVQVIGGSRWRSAVDERIENNKESLASWKNDDALRAYADRVLHGKRKELLGW